MPAPASLPDAPIPFDLPCARCGYNLISLLPSGACPECAAPIINSFYGGALPFANPEYLRALRSGALLVAINAFLAPTFLFARFLAPAVFTPGLRILSSSRSTGASYSVTSTTYTVPAPPAWMATLKPIASLAIVATAVLGLIGWWLLTTREPHARLREHPQLRRIIRIAVVVLLLSAAFEAARTLAVAAASLGAGPMSFISLGAVCMSVFWLFAVLFKYWAGLTHMKRLGSRARDSFILSRAGVLEWGIFLVAGALVVIGFIALAFGPSTPRAVGYLWLTLFALTLLAAAYYYASIFLRLRRLITGFLHTTAQAHNAQLPEGT